MMTGKREYTVGELVLKFSEQVVKEVFRGENILFI